jgi:DNA-binding response OmpR family regulator
MWMVIPRVLFIDDDLSVRALAAAMLERKGYRMLMAFNTAQADRILQQESIDLIICDILMEGEDGISYTRRLRQRGVKTPILILSAISQQAVVQKGLDAGATEYLVKPFDIGEFERRIVALLPKLLKTKTDPPQNPKSLLSRLTHRKP